MMQVPKYEFMRKPKRQGSRDKLLAVGGRQKSRESEERRSQEPTSSKPHQLITSLRSQLTNLKQQVAKLSKKDARKPLPPDPEHRSPRDRKPVASYYFEDVQSTLLEDETTMTKGRSADPTPHRPSPKGQTSEMEQMRERVTELQQHNQQLVRRNEELSQRVKEISEAVKKEYEMKLYQLEVQRERSARQKNTQQTDRTITFQKQLVENKQQIEQLRQAIDKLTNQNEELKAKFDRARGQAEKARMEAEKREQQLRDKEDQIHQINLTIKESEREQQTKDQQHRLEMDSLKQQLTDIKRQMNSISSVAQLATTKYEASEKKSIDLQRKVEQLTEKLSKSAHSQGDKRKSRAPSEVRQLNEIISMQQKSLLNQQSDINYLENEVRRLAHFKQVSRCQAHLLEEVNSELLHLNLSRLNEKYSQL